MERVSDVLKLVQQSSRLNDEQRNVLNEFTDSTNRSNGQTALLFGLCGNDFEKLLVLERKLKGKCFCPGDVETVNLVLSLPDDTYNYRKYKL